MWGPRANALSSLGPTVLPEDLMSLSSLLPELFSFLSSHSIPLARALVVLYFGLLLTLCAYGAHRSQLLWRLKRLTRLKQGVQASSNMLPTDWPPVTVQLPLFNERFVVERLLDAVSRLEYPPEKLQIQVLDDSTDETTTLAASRVAQLQARGLNIALLHRTDRSGFKAGALEAGLSHATGTLIAIFDADFVPPPDFLLRCVPAFDGPRVGMVQARWGHLNAEYSLLTRLQAILLDAHFQIEHASRHAAGHFFNFNGTAGIWRRQCIEDAGGWQHDTLTEDLDLSYRAQLKGWKFRYLPEVVCPAELPADMQAFKSQQQRWAKGAAQVALKLLPRILTHNLPLGIRRDAFFHLTGSLTYVGMTLLALLLPISVWLRERLGSSTQGYESLLWLDGLIFAISIGSVTHFYWTAQGNPPRDEHSLQESSPSILLRLFRIGVVMAVGAGLSLSNAVAVIEALLGRSSPFVRTPKLGIQGRRGRVRGYPLRSSWISGVELMIAAYLGLGIVYAVTLSRWGSVPFLAIFMLGYLYVGTSGWKWRSSRSVVVVAEEVG